MLKAFFAMVLMLQMLILPSPLGAEDESPFNPTEVPMVDVGLDPGHSDADVGAAGGGHERLVVERDAVEPAVADVGAVLER